MMDISTYEIKRVLYALSTEELTNCRNCVERFVEKSTTGCTFRKEVTVFSSLFLMDEHGSM